MTGSMSPDATGEIARFVSEARFEDLASATVEQLKRLILDGVANAVGGLSTAASRIQGSVVSGLGSERAARVLGSGEHVSVLAASYVNAACANALDFDDTYKTFLHPGATAVPPSFAVAEKVSAHGRDVLAAVAVGYEVAIRVAEAAFPSPERLRQVWGFATWQTLGSAAAAASLLGLDTETTRHALGAAAFNAPVPSVRKIGLEPEDRPLSWTKNNYGWAAMGGVLGALLARDGFRSSRTVLDGDHGFWTMAGSDRFDAELLTAGLGEEFRLGATRIKPYASCRWTHSALDCVRQLRRSGELPPLADIERVEVHTFRELASNFTNPAPEDIVDAQFSLPYLLALELVERSPGRGLKESDLTDPAVLGVAARIAVHHDEEMDASFHHGQMPSRVVFRTRSGKVVEVAVADPVWGAPEDPFTDDDLMVKCTALLEPAWGRAATRKLIEGILDLDRVTDLATILPE
ncbi:MmgE/PrpD family protein [Streptomyces bathyalis]|uniref:MmgE/PrpD family protein n=1 Tax=Streptomyces bathyalis TaxID=2710756 RepID=A0A7T1WUZ3_9ACTN|nr:MmgE/PrpD family protein [Streptomyces bathyalis]QPP10181.1 MmgE/PrpD family protein [Streptomyces bathyalis]